MLKRLRDEAEADIADIYDDDGELLPEREWPLVWRQGVGKVSDRIRRLELIGKHVDVRAFVERKEVTGKDGAPIESTMVFTAAPVVGKVPGARMTAGLAKREIKDTLAGLGA